MVLSQYIRVANEEIRIRTKQMPKLASLATVEASESWGRGKYIIIFSQRSELVVGADETFVTK